MYWLTKLAKHKFIMSLAVVAALGVMLAPAPSNALDPDDKFGLDPIDEELGTALGNQDLRTTVARLINVALSLLGIVAVVIILIGGFKWMTAGGNEDKVAEARKLIFSGIIGLAIILSAWAIALFVINQLNQATTDSDAGIPTDLLIE